MTDLNGRVAVVTGAASGIGLALAQRCAKEGMRVVMADVDDRLREVADSVAESGAEVLGIETDVSSRASMEELARRTTESMGTPYLLFNNAGVERLAPLTETPLEVYDWIVGVNLWGVIHGLHYFLPDMLARDEGHIVNTSSGSGLLVGTLGNGAYAATKHAVVALSETLFHELRARGSHVHVSVLCPGAVRTGIHQSERNWPTDLGEEPALSPHARSLRQAVLDHTHTEHGMTTGEVAEIVFDHLDRGRFWIHTHPELLGPSIRARWLAAAEGADPPLPMLPVQLVDHEAG